LTQQHPATDTTEPTIETPLINLTVDSSWSEILAELHQIQDELSAIKTLEAPENAKEHISDS